MEKQETQSQKGGQAYQFEELPGNIRQMGEQPPKNRIYIEDYVVTYMHQIFQKKPEKAVVIFLGKNGEAAARDASFVYGAVEAEVDLSGAAPTIDRETWEEIYREAAEYFPGAQVLGWGCGVGMRNSRIDDGIQKIQREHFAQEEKLLFVEDLGEKEESVYRWHQGRLEEQAGYVIYYGKNPQMQDYMLRGQPKQSFESSYQDEVTSNVRHVVSHREEPAEKRSFAYYGVGVAMLFLTLLGANLLLQSNQKIDSLEKTLETLSNKTTGQTATVSPTKQAAETASGQAVQEQTDNKETALPTMDGALAGMASTVPPFETPAVATTPTATATPAAQAATQKPQVDSESSDDKKTDKKAAATAAPQKTKQPVKQSAADKKSQQASSLWGKTQSYVVRAGDTLSQIVWRQYHSLDYLELVKKANNIEDEDAITQGQRIVLPQYKK